jgi:hypothetical protein
MDSAGFGISPLHLAISSDHLPVIQLLADRLKRSEAIWPQAIWPQAIESRGAREILEKAEDIWRLKGLVYRVMGQRIKT